MQPFFENNIYMYYYFVIFIIIGLFLPLSMLTGAIVANFDKLKIKISIFILFMPITRVTHFAFSSLSLMYFYINYKIVAVSIY